MARTGLGRQNTSAKTLTGNGSCELRTTSPSRTESWNRGASPSTDTNSKAGPPTIDSVDAVDESLVVAWSVPEQTAGLPVTGYDLRHILTDDDETMDSNWTVVEDVWTAAAGGALEYAIEGLALRERHEVQVRATNDWGKGEWSAIATGTPGNARPVFSEGSATDRSILENSAFGNNVGDPVAATDADGDTLTYTLGGVDAGPFDIDAANGQITVGAATILDYETQTTYTVVVTATDIFDVIDTVTVTIIGDQRRPARQRQRLRRGQKRENRQD